MSQDYWRADTYSCPVNLRGAVEPRVCASWNKISLRKFRCCLRTHLALSEEPHLKKLESSSNSWYRTSEHYASRVLFLSRSDCRHRPCGHVLSLASHIIRALLTVIRRHCDEIMTCGIGWRSFLPGKGLPQVLWNRLERKLRKSICWATTANYSFSPVHNCVHPQFFSYTWTFTVIAVKRFGSVLSGGHVLDRTFSLAFRVPRLFSKKWGGHIALSSTICLCSVFLLNWRNAVMLYWVEKGNWAL